MINDELLTLRNLGKTSAQWLHATGIHSRDDLRQRGPVEAYCAVRARGFRASKSLMFAIAGALEDVHWNELPADYKEQLREQLKEHQMSAHSRRD
ncbi:MAG: TfoX/Sxy family protein [Pseudoalteromonas distincta]|jgi:DNA transformation protein and related proteins|tara:strand:+ start:9482 stop:9766 length:285 start_codon:yes stop_codon:yes gene_type:complete